jgi:hypothetical protein
MIPERVTRHLSSVFFLVVYIFTIRKIKVAEERRMRRMRGTYITAMEVIVEKRR